MVAQFPVMLGRELAKRCCNWMCCALYSRTGFPSRLIPLFDQAIALNPAPAEAHYTARQRAEKRRTPRGGALAGYDHAIARKEDYAHAYCNRAVGAAGARSEGRPRRSATTAR